jgi:hypothetical protein
LKILTKALCFLIFIIRCEMVEAQEFDVVVCESCVSTNEYQAKALEKVDNDYTTGFMQRMLS